jgi:hypothetical protein
MQADLPSFHSLCRAVNATQCHHRPNASIMFNLNRLSGSIHKLIKKHCHMLQHDPVVHRCKQHHNFSTAPP